MAINSKIILSLIGLSLLTSCAKDEGVSLLGNGSDDEIVKYIYLTDTTNDAASKGGISGADSMCMNDANYPGTGTYKAMLVDGTTRVACTTADCSGGTAEHVDWVLQPDTVYRRVSDDEVIGVTSPDGIMYMDMVNAWDASWNSWISTGLAVDWTSTDDCTNWSGNGGFGAYGTGLQTDSDSYADGSVSCTTATKIICVEQ